MVQAVVGSSPISHPRNGDDRAQDCGPEGRRFDPDIPPHAGVVQRLVCKFSKLEIGFRLPSPAPEKVKNKHKCLFFEFLWSKVEKKISRVLIKHKHNMACLARI